MHSPLTFHAQSTKQPKSADFPHLLAGRVKVIFSTQRFRTMAESDGKKPITVKELSFHSLPGEIRNSIYRFALTGQILTLNDNYWAENSTKWIIHETFGALLRTSHQIHSEALTLFYDECEFDLRIWEGTSDLLGRCVYPIGQWVWIRHLTIYFNAGFSSIGSEDVCQIMSYIATHCKELEDLYLTFRGRGGVGIPYCYFPYELRELEEREKLVEAIGTIPVKKWLVIMVGEFTERTRSNMRACVTDLGTRKGWEMESTEHDGEADVAADEESSTISGSEFHYYGMWQLKASQESIAAGAISSNKSKPSSVYQVS